MKRIIITIASAILCLSAGAQELRSEVFDLLNLDHAGLEQVKQAHESGDDALAASALLDYYRGRKGICTPEIKDVRKVSITQQQAQWAEDAMKHTFFVHYGYQPSFNYGEDIDWKYWPVKDNELRWQLHRHKWFTSLGRAYRVTKEEKYATEWAAEYIDWIRKNPYDPEGDAENFRFAWRPLEVSHRLQDQCLQFQLCLDAEAFTPEFLTEFLVNYHRHAVHIINNYSDQGNHLLFEAQRIICAGAFFPEFKEAAQWRESGIEILNREIGVQVYPDGGQFELDPHYHLAAIGIFYKALQIADLNGFRNAFPQEYIDCVERMITFYSDICYPDYTNPCFSDAKITKKGEVIKDYKAWHRLFPDNNWIAYLASEGMEGSQPDYESVGYQDSGFYVFRNSRDAEDGIQMVVKAGPPAFWHNQPDNGTFELWYNGRRLFADSGSYVYAGEDPEVNEWRAWFRRTDSHNTLTLNSNNIETTDSKTLLWKPEGDVQILVTENKSYEKLTHRRSIFFVDKSYFVIVDEAYGIAKGTVNLNYQMPRGPMENNREAMIFTTTFDDEIESNMKLQVFGPDGMNMKKSEGWVSSEYQKKQKRPKISFNYIKRDNEPVRYVTVIVPKKTPGDDVAVSAKILSKTFDGKTLKLQVKVGKVKKVLEYTL